MQVSREEGDKMIPGKMLRTSECFWGVEVGVGRVSCGCQNKIISMSAPVYCLFMFFFQVCH